MKLEGHKHSVTKKGANRKARTSQSVCIHYLQGLWSKSSSSVILKLKCVLESLGRCVWPEIAGFLVPQVSGSLDQWWGLRICILTSSRWCFWSGTTQWEQVHPIFSLALDHQSALEANIIISWYLQETPTVGERLNWVQRMKFSQGVMYPQGHPVDPRQDKSRVLMRSLGSGMEPKRGMKLPGIGSFSSSRKISLQFWKVA